MLITYCSNDLSAKYGSNVFAVEAALLPHESADAFNRYAHVVPMEVEPDNVWGCPGAMVIDIGNMEHVTPAIDPVNPTQACSPCARPKSNNELLVDQRATAVQTLSSVTERLIKSVANPDTQASLALLFPSMSGPDFDRAVTYFDWHKKMLAKHYEIKNQLVASTTLDALQAVVGDEFAGQYAELMSAAPHDSVNLSSYTD